MTPIRNSLHVLESSPPGGEEATRALATMKRQVTHLSRLVDDLLDVTRITSGKVRLQREGVDLVQLVRRTVEDHAAQLEGRTLTVKLPDTLRVDGDATRLAQVVGNLLQNAAKFTEPGQAVSVSLAREGTRATLEVRDTGMGIDAETLKGLFVPFTQADRSLDRSRGGLGLGLALVKSLVELHGGSVLASSDGPGRGARFTIELPCDEASETVVVAVAPVKTTPGPRRVLIIEDNVDVAQSLADVLEMSGHETAIAFDGPSGVEKARALTPDIVLCDIGLPGAFDGYAVAHQLRQDARLKHAFCVALSGYAQPEDQKKARDAGFDAHLAKPPDPDVLQQLLARAPVRRPPAI
jgi:two-component system CheB/CheR fusion protein